MSSTNNVSTKNNFRTVTSFTEKEYKQSAQNANFQKLASIFGFKPTANKVLYTVYKDNITSWEKVEDIASTTSTKTKYLGGSSNIEKVIVNTAKTYMGSNNISVLSSRGDFGARLNSAAAAGRYIQTKKNDLFDKLFNKDDANVVPQYSFEGHNIEYRFFTWHLPFLLINGSDGMGSGHAQYILGRNPEELRLNLLKHLKTNSKIECPKPWYKGFKGKIEKSDNRWLITGCFERKNNNTTYITEIPIIMSVKEYRKKLDTMLDKKIINNYEDLCDPKKDLILFEIKHSKEVGLKSDEELFDLFKLTNYATENYTCIDENNKVFPANTAEEILERYISVKLHYTEQRKLYLLQKMRDDLSVLLSKAFFIMSVIKGDILINNKKKNEIEEQIKQFDKIITVDDSYDYLLRMPLYSLTKEKVEEIKELVKKTKENISLTESITSKDLWIQDLEKLAGVFK